MNSSARAGTYVNGLPAHVNRPLPGSLSFGSLGAGPLVAATITPISSSNAETASTSWVRLCADRTITGGEGSSDSA